MCVRVCLFVCVRVSVCVFVWGEREIHTLDRPECEEASLPSGEERASRQTPRFKHLRGGGGGGGGGSQAEDETERVGEFLLVLLKQRRAVEAPAGSTERKH